MPAFVVAGDDDTAKAVHAPAARTAGACPCSGTRQESSSVCTAPGVRRPSSSARTAVSPPVRHGSRPRRRSPHRPDALGGSSACDTTERSRGRTVPANANEWVAPATHPIRRRAREASQDCGRLPWFAPFLRRAFFLRRRFEDIEPPFSGFRSLSTGRSRPVTTEPLSSRRDGKHTRCGCTRVAYVTVVARPGRVANRQSARAGCVRFAPFAGSNTWALAMSTRSSSGSPSRARVAASRRATS